MSSSERQEYNMLANSVADVRNFGASPKGDIDCTEAVIKALTSIEEGGTLYFPSGTYLIENPVKVSGDHLTITGDGKHSKIIYTYEQKDDDNGSTASLFSFADNISDLKVKDLYLEYRGEFFDEPMKSYYGKISAFYFGICFDVFITNIEVTGFNANAIAFIGSSEEYSKRLKVDKCYLHHNRVAGILYGYVDGLTITNNNLEYHGSKYDGGTGYGCAGSSGGKPLNIQIIGNKASFNYRKGIDLHAGKKALIEGNICEGNVLSGIYAEGRYTNDITITGNMITDMYLENPPYQPEATFTWMECIGFGFYGGVANEREERNFTICENEISGFSYENGSGILFHCYYGQHCGTIQIKNNIVKAGKIGNIAVFSGKGIHTEKCENVISITGNHFKFDECKGNMFVASSFDTFDFSHNRINAGKAMYPFILTPGANNSAFFASYNNLSFKDMAANDKLPPHEFTDTEKLFFELGENTPYDYPKIIKDNVLNGKIIS